MALALRGSRIRQEATKGAAMTALLEHPVKSHDYPCAELHKTDVSFAIEVETPGCGPEDLEVQVDGNRVTVLGTPSDLPHPFTFVFDLPADVNLDRLHAVFENGVLRVDAPRLARSMQRTLEIETPHL
jgi:HSP20 family molecular chaperone IbpA